MSINKTLFRNFSSLTLIQVSNYLFPLITFPYLVRVLGVEGFGLINFSAAFIAYFHTLVDYGFTYSATREVSIHRNNKQKLIEIFNAVLLIKFSLIIVSFIILFILVTFIPKFNYNRPVYFLTFILVIGRGLSPLWFFQGIEKMKYLLYISVIIRALYVILIFLLVRSSGDLLTAVFLNSASYLVIGLIALSTAVLIFGIKFRIPSFEVVKFHFIDSGYIFISTAAINLYTTTNIFLLGLFTNDAIVGYFAAADKIRIAVQGAFSSIAQSIYPHLSKLFNENLEIALIFVRKVVKYIGLIVFILSLILFIFAYQIIRLIVGPGYPDSVILLQIIAFLPFIIFLSNIAGIQTMLNLNYKKEFTRIIVIAAIMNIVFSIILIPVFQAIGTAVSMVITEIYVSTAMIIFLKNKGITLITFNSKM